MSEAKRMSQARFETLAQALTLHGPRGSHRLANEADRARASEAALEARLAAGVEAANKALRAMAALASAVHCGEPMSAQLRGEIYAAGEALRAFVDGKDVR